MKQFPATLPTSKVDWVAWTIIEGLYLDDYQDPGEEIRKLELSRRLKNSNGKTNPAPSA